MGLVSEVCGGGVQPQLCAAPRSRPPTRPRHGRHNTPHQSIAVGFFGLSGNWSSRPKETTGNISSVCSFGAPHMDNV